MNGKALGTRRIAGTVVLALSLSLLATQAAAAFDGRSPDTRAAAAVQQGGGLMLDLRSPDTREAAVSLQVAATTAPAIDLRSPDTRTPIAGTATRGTSTLATASSGFDWADFGMGAGITAGAILLAGLAAAALMAGRRRGTPSTV